jgi:hypothetical protein
MLSSLGFEKKTFTWGELKERAKPTKSKGTYWLEELGRNVCGIAGGDAPAMMTSTFRGIGQGKIFHPTLYRVDRNNDRPFRFFVLISEQIAPETVRPPGKLGRLFLLIQIANRTRYEVVEPFLSEIKHAPKKAEAQIMFRKVNESFEAIIEQAQRDGCYEKDAFLDAFPEDFYETARLMWESRQEIWERTRNLTALRPADDEDAPKSNTKSSAWALRELEKTLVEWRRKNSHFLELASFCYHVQLRKDYDRIANGS